MPPIVAITTFNIDHYTAVDTFLEEYRTIGLDTLELNGRVRSHVIDALLPFIERKEIRISSLHNFCPRPEIPGHAELELSSPDEPLRQLAVQYTQRTIATAHRLGAKAVVLHAGEMQPLRPLVNTLKELYRAGQRHSAEFARIQDELRMRRSQECQPYVQAAEKSLAELVEYVLRSNMDVKLGLETRDYYGQIPQIEEYDAWFARYDGSPVGLWYDLGHAEILEKLGFGIRDALFARHGHRLVGLHLHDCLGIHDHIVPGTGEINFALIKPYLRPDVLRVLEYGSQIQPITRIPDGIHYLRQAGIL